MYALQPALRLGRDVWNRDAMPIQEFLDRADRLRGAMGRAGLDAMLLFGSGLDSCGHPTYVSNYIVKLPCSALVVLPREGEPALMFEGATRGRAAARETTWIEDVRPCWNMAETCLAVLAARDLQGATIGLAAMPRLVPHAEWTSLVSGLPRATLLDAEHLISDQRAIKSSRERGQVRRASDIVNRALESVPLSAAPNESALAARLIREARMQGAEDIRLMVARLMDSDRSFRPPETMPVREGETLAVNFRASWERYWSEATQTFAMRGNRLMPVWDGDMRARFGELVSRARPGTPVAGWVRGALAAMTSEERRALEPCGFGHGIGVTADEPPILSVESRATIAAGMCLVVSAALTSREGMTLRAETVVV